MWNLRRVRSAPCAKTLRFERLGERIGYEDLLLLHAAGLPSAEWRREHLSSAVMMIPIPRSGIFRRVDGVEAAGAVPYVDDIQITAKPDQQLLALPEGASYLGFIFARATTARDADARYGRPRGYESRSTTDSGAH